MRSSNLLKILYLLLRYFILGQLDTQVFETKEFIKQGIKSGIWIFPTRIHLHWILYPHESAMLQPLL